MTQRIAVIEDEADIRTLIVEELEDEGYEVQTACNGAEGLEMIQRYKPQLILSDITMPILDGYGMLEKLRELKAFRSTPIVFLSALADRRHIIKGKRLGVDDYVTKPIDFELLIATVEARLREVERMTVEKEEQMVKLVSSFMTQPQTESRVKPALIVAQEWMELDAVEASLKKLGIPFVMRHRGSLMDAFLKERAYSSIFVTQHTNDLNAREVVECSELFSETNVPKYLIIEDSKSAQDMSHWSEFTRIISLDNAKHADIEEVIGAHV